MDAIAIQSYDFVNSSYFVSPNDIVVVFSHRGTKTFSVRALEMAKRRYNAYTALITGLQSPISINTEIGCGAFTISLTSAINPHSTIPPHLVGSSRIWSGAIMSGH